MTNGTPILESASRNDAHGLERRYAADDRGARNGRTQQLFWRSHIATYGLCAAIALAPLPFGLTQLTPMAVWIALLAIVLLLGHTDTTSRDNVLSAAFGVVAASWATVVAVQSIETPLTSHLIHPIWAETKKMLAIDVPGSVSAVRDAPLLGAGAQIASGLAFLCGYFVGRNHRAARMMLKAFAASSLVYAIYGIMAFVLAPGYVLWLEKVAYRDALTATFINANTAAVYFGAASVAWLLLLLDNLHERESPRERHWLGVRSRYSSRRTIQCFLAFVLVLSASFMTGSRLGSMLTLFGTIGAATLFYRARFNSWRAMISGALLAIAAVVVALLVLGGRVNQRFDVSGLTDEMRVQAYLSTLRIVQDFPWLGTGLGTFRWVFPAYRSGEISIVGIWDRAHSTTLELAAEMGIPFAALVVLIWLTIMVVLALGMIRRRRDDILPISAFWIASIALLHSQMDFSLQIPGFAIVVLALAGMGVAQSASRAKKVNSGKADGLA